MMNKSLRARSQESSRKGDYGFRGVRREPRAIAFGDFPKKKAAVSGGCEVNNKGGVKQSGQEPLGVQTGTDQS
jgi:hypothetical protein